jgi:BON domain
MAEHEMWRGEAPERRRVMEQMEDDRASRWRHVMRDGGGDEEHRRRLAEQRGGQEQERGGAGGGHRGRGPRGYRRSDERITEDLHDRLTEDPRLDASEIQVAVTDGEVTLTGNVDGRAARRRAEDIAESVSGVSYVMNNLRVRQPGTTGATG